jgi:hypothetical protein
LDEFLRSGHKHLDTSTPTQRYTRVAARELRAPSSACGFLFHTLLELTDVTDVRSNIAIRTAKEHGPLPLASG